jgi:hypothetical protein
MGDLTTEEQSLRATNTFAEAAEVLTRWLGPGAVKPSGAHFGLIESEALRWIDHAQTFSERLEGLAFIGRLWSLSSWRSAPSAEAWTAKMGNTLLEPELPLAWIEELADWGSADERRFVSNALEVVPTERASDLALVILCTEPTRKSTKATSHHLDCLRRREVTMEAIAERAPAIWRRVSAAGNGAPTTALFRFENFAGALAQARWADRQIGSPDLASLPLPLTDAAQSAQSDTRENAAEQMLRLLATYRQSTSRRKDLRQGYEGAVRLLAWFPGRRLPSVLQASLDELLDDLEQDLISRLELGRREGELRDLHQTLIGSAHSTSRLVAAAKSAKLSEQQTIWLRTGRWLDLESGDQSLAEAAAQDLDPLIAELLIDLEQLALQRDSRIGDAIRKAQALGRARGLAIFGTPGEIVEYDPQKHHLTNDALGRDSRVAIIRQGVTRKRSTGETVVAKATVRNAEF